MNGILSYEDGESLTYSLVNPSNQFSQRFSLNRTTGALAVFLQSGSKLDYEVAESYTFTVKVTDSIPLLDLEESGWIKPCTPSRC